MGKYINEINGVSMGASFESKALVLASSGARSIEPPIEWEEGLVCLVDNGWMAAAAYAYDESEMTAFLHPDGRPKQWFMFKDASKWLQ